MKNQYDVAIIGGGHNGLVAAAYLARAGLDVGVLEARPVVGGAAVTEEFHPGFRNSLAAYTVSLLDPRVIADLGLADHGLRIVERRMSNFLPLDDGRALEMGGDPANTRRSIAQFSNTDADQLTAYGAMLDGVVAELRALVHETPPNPGGGWRDALKALALGNRLRRLGLARQRDLMDLFAKSAGDMLDSWFESAPLKAALGFDGIVGSYASPYTPGTAYVLLHHVFGEVNGKPGAWGHAIGGMGAITQAMAKAATAAGADIITAAPVREIVTSAGRASGVVLADGRRVSARAVAGNVHPKRLLGEMLDPALLDADLKRRLAGYRSGSGVVRMNVALSELPRFTARPAAGDHLTSGIIIAPSLDYMDRAYGDARRAGWSAAPIVEMLIPSTLDNSLAPPGQHVASLFAQAFEPELKALGGGASWDDHRDSVADLIIDTVDAHAPNFKASVLARRVLTPLDLERELGLIGGDIFHGQLTPDQLFSARPLLGHSAYRMPVKGLYLCGSGAHPGGGVSGLPGRNAAREMIRDFRWRRA